MRLQIVAWLLFAAGAEASPAREAASAALRLVAYSSPLTGRASWTTVQEGDAQADACHARVAAAVSSGLDRDGEFELQVGERGLALPQTRPGFSTLALLDGFCARQKATRVQLLRAALTVSDAADELGYLRRARLPPGVLRGRLVESARLERACSREVKRALDHGNPTATALPLPETTLGAAEAGVCAALRAQIGVAAGSLPRVAALGGDRARVYRDEALFIHRVWGASHVLLDKAADLARAPAWFVELPEQDDGGGRSWHVRRFTFRGDTLAGTHDSQGAERAAPPSEFR